MNYIEFTPEKLAALKKAKAEADKRGQQSFMFEGQELLSSYAKYMIEYLEGKFGATS
jgi:hypothetical protein